MQVSDYSGAKGKASREEIIGTHATLIQAKHLTKRARGLRILFLGETGTGKTPFARYSNLLLDRPQKGRRPFEQVNCACLNAEYFQDILFGHRKGAFTGATSDKMGLVELARGGDLFLDEIGDMPLATQAHLLTFLDSLEYYRLGDDHKRTADIRLLTATNHDLSRLVAQGKFRKDLYSRLSQVVVRIPSLRERATDLPLLFEYFIYKFTGYVKPYDAKILGILQRQTWEEGNVREFKDAVEYLCLMSDGADTIQVSHLGDRLLPQSPLELPSLPEAVPLLGAVYQLGLENYLDHVERRVLESLLQRDGVKMGRLASDLKISRSTLYRRLVRLDLHQRLALEDSPL